MARGFDQHKQRVRSLAAFGKSLARRARSKCELCGASGSPLIAHEIPPVPVEPEFDRCLMLCETCSTELAGGEVANPERWRCLNNTVWSETPAVQAGAVMVLRRLAPESAWAGELLDQLYLAEGTRRLLGEGEALAEG